MPDLAITLSSRAAKKLQLLVDRTNRAQNLNLSLPEWITLHLKEQAIVDDLNAALKSLQEKGEVAARDALEQAVRDERARQLADLDRSP